MNHKASLGLTLIELLVAITLLSMVILSGYYAYSIIAFSWQKQAHLMEVALHKRGEINKLDAIIKGVMPWTIRNSQNEGAFFFVGKSDSLLAVTSNGLFDEKYPEIFRLVVQQDDSGEPYLLYQAASSKNISLVNSSQSIQFQHEVVFMSAMPKFSFNYFGASQLSAMNEEPIFSWSNEFSGLDRQLMPQKLMLTIGNESYQFRLRANYQYNAAKLLNGYFDEVTF